MSMSQMSRVLTLGDFAELFDHYLCQTPQQMNASCRPFRSQFEEMLRCTSGDLLPQVRNLVGVKTQEKTDQLFPLIEDDLAGAEESYELFASRLDQLAHSSCEKQEIAGHILALVVLAEIWEGMIDQERKGRKTIRRWHPARCGGAR